MFFHHYFERLCVICSNPFEVIDLSKNMAKLMRLPEKKNAHTYQALSQWFSKERRETMTAPPQENIWQSLEMFLS